MRHQSEVYERQLRLGRLYNQNPSLAKITGAAEAIGEKLDDPFHTKVIINDKKQVPFHIGMHRAIGGEGDLPTPGDLLCAALASSFESTLRWVANRLQLQLDRIYVRTAATTDARGVLMFDNKVPVGIQSMQLEVEIGGDTVRDSAMKILINATRHCCIIYQTISQGIPVEIKVNVLKPELAFAE